RFLRAHRPLHSFPPRRSSDLLTPNDLSQCEFALVREIAELRGLLPATPEREFMAERVAALTAAQRERVSKEYRRRYSRMFVHLEDRKSTRLNSSHVSKSYAVF